MAKLALVNGLPRMVAESGSPTIYDDYLKVVLSGASGANEINLADVQTGDEITLPNSGTYESDELEIYLNGKRIDDVFDFNYVGSGTRTQVAMTFDLEVDDVLRFRVDRGA
jgi:hypothetical protein